MYNQTSVNCSAIDSCADSWSYWVCGKHIVQFGCGMGCLCVCLCVCVCVCKGNLHLFVECSHLFSPSHSHLPSFCCLTRQTWKNQLTLCEFREYLSTFLHEFPIIPPPHTHTHTQQNRPLTVAGLSITISPVQCDPAAWSGTQRRAPATGSFKSALTNGQGWQWLSRLEGCLSYHSTSRHYYSH